MLSFGVLSHAVLLIVFFLRYFFLGAELSPLAGWGVDTLRLATLTLMAVVASVASFLAEACVADTVCWLTTSSRFKASRSLSARGSSVLPMRSWTRSICPRRRSSSTISSSASSSKGASSSAALSSSLPPCLWWRSLL